MDNDQMLCFLSAAKHLSFTKAAEERHMAQTTVSRQIAALEKELGTPLFERRGRALTLTPTGRYMIGTAHAYTDQYARIVASVRRVSANDNAPLLVRTGPWESYLLSEPMRQFVQQAGPAATLSCNSNSYRILQERMSSKDLSLAFCDERYTLNKYPSFAVHKIYRRPWLVAATPDHPFWQLSPEQQGWLEGQYVITGTGTKNEPIESWCLEHGMKQKGFLHGSLLATQLTMARTGNGVLLVPPWLPDYVLTGLRTADCLAVPYAPTIVMVINKDRSHPQQPLLQDLCLEHFKQLNCL